MRALEMFVKHEVKARYKKTVVCTSTTGNFKKAEYYVEYEVMKV